MFKVVVVLSGVLFAVVGGILDSKPVSYDPNIECDLAELIWGYAKKLLPAQGDFKSVYDAVNLGSCHKNADHIFNNLKKRYHHIHDLRIIVSQCWASYFVKVTNYILLATELFSYSYILPIK